MSGPLRIGRYVLHGEIASGGMGTVHYGRLTGSAGFQRPVAIKRLHSALARDPETLAMFIDEAHVASHVRHPNVVATLDVISQDAELFLVMDYVAGESLSRLARAARAAKDEVPIAIAAAIICETLDGLHAAHEAKDERGEPLEVIHRDVSPQNILIGIDGHARVADFGIAKAAGRMHVTRDGRQKGKPAYMAPEQMRGGPLDRRADIWAAGVVLWELLTGERLFQADNDVALVTKVLSGEIPRPSARRPEAACLDDVVLRALAPKRTDRYATAAQMSAAVRQAAGTLATNEEVGTWVDELASDRIAARAKEVAELDATIDATPVTLPAGSAAAPGAGADGHAAARADSVAPGASAEGRAASHAPPSPAPASRWRFIAGALFGAAMAAAIAVAVTRRAPPDAPAPAPSAVATEDPIENAADPAEPVEPAPVGSTHASPALRRPPRTTRKPGRCTVRSYVDDAGVKHFFEDCPK